MKRIILTNISDEDADAIYDVLSIVGCPGRWRITMERREYMHLSEKITDEQDAIRDKLATTLDTQKGAELTGKIDGLELARAIIHEEVNFHV